MTGSNRIDVLLDAAIEVVAAEGLRGLTHRAVDARAGLSAGSTSYYYRTRMALLEAVLGRVLSYDVGAPVPKRMNRLGALSPTVHGFFVPIDKPTPRRHALERPEPESTGAEPTGLDRPHAKVGSE